MGFPEQDFSEGVGGGVVKNMCRPCLYAETVIYCYYIVQ